MKNMKRLLLLTVLAATVLTGCGQEEKKPKAVQTETYTEENTVTVVSHDTEGIDFRIAVLPEMSEGLTRLIQDAKREEAANDYRFYEYTDIEKYRALFDCGTIDIATMTLSDALKIYQENLVPISVIAINSELEEDLGVTIVTRSFAAKYPAALKVFIEEMKYSAKESFCVTGEEMCQQLESYLTEAGYSAEELPGTEFYDPFFVEPSKVAAGTEETGQTGEVTND